MKQLVILMIFAVALVSCGKKHEMDMGSVMNVIAAMDSDKDHMVSKQEWKDDFYKKDLDKSGEISRDEMHKHHLTVHKSDMNFDKMFAMTDKDANNSITMEECMGKFAEMDLDKNGSLDHDEFVARMKM